MLSFQKRTCTQYLEYNFRISQVKNLIRYVNVLLYGKGRSHFIVEVTLTWKGKNSMLNSSPK